MFTRVVEIHTKPGKTKDFSATLHEKVLPILQKQPGFMDEITLVSSIDPEFILALSFWKNEADAERYHETQFSNVTEILSATLEAAPKVKTFNVDTSTTHKIVKGKAA